MDLASVYPLNNETDEVGEHLVAYLAGPGSRAFLKPMGGGLAGAELFPENDTTFFLPFSDISFQGTFIRNKKGKTTGMVVNLGGKKIKGVRVGRYYP